MSAPPAAQAYCSAKDWGCTSPSQLDESSFLSHFMYRLELNKAEHPYIAPISVFP